MKQERIKRIEFRRLRRLLRFL